MWPETWREEERGEERGQSPDACVLRMRATSQGLRYIRRGTTLAGEESRSGSECRGECVRETLARGQQRDRQP